MVEIEGVYEGGLHTRARHGPSGSEIETDAPVDNHGRGEAFSPTDLVAAAVGSCMLTVMGIVAARHHWPLVGARFRVEKHMAAAPVRRIARLVVEFTLPEGLPEAAHKPLERAAHTCPVHQSLHPDVEVDVRFRWPESAGAPAPAQ
ncbi:MAG: OsmC family protein [Proteobacteria bacterium]|nr:OsmC family protein [Pseudomonadota bacterium]